MIKVKKAETRPYKRIVLGGTPSIGKTTAAANWSSKGLWIDLDNRIPEEKIGGCHVLDGVTDYPTILEALRYAIKETGQFDTLIIDTATLMEALCKQYAIDIDFKGNANSYGSYSTGDKNNLPVYVGKVLALLDEVASKKSCDIILICHTDVKPVKNPNGENYDREQLALTGAIRSKVLQWADLVGFAWVDVEVEQVGMSNKAKSGARMISFSNNPSYDAKGPADLPPKIPFDLEGEWIKQIKQPKKENK